MQSSPVARCRRYERCFHLCEHLRNSPHWLLGTLPAPTALHPGFEPETFGTKIRRNCQLC